MYRKFLNATISFTGGASTSLSTGSGAATGSDAFA
jgi:hypothetical protein